MAINYKTILGFSGINRDVSSFLNTEGEYLEAQNVVTNKIGVLKKSGDYEIKGVQITDNYSILGGVDWLRADGTHTHLVVCDGGSVADIYKYITTTWTAQSQSLTKTAKVRFAQCLSLDTLFAVNYSDSTRSYNGSAWSTSTNVTGCPKAKFIIEFGSRIYVLNCVVGATSYPTRAYRSSTTETTITWDTTNDWILYDDVITGVGKNGENMFVGCQNSIYIFTLNDDKYQVSGHGCVSHEGITTYGSTTYWPARDGMYSFNGGDDKKISMAVQDYWDAIPEANLPEIQAKVLGHHLYVYIGDVTIDGRALANVMFDYDILRNDWNKLSLASECKNLHLYVTTSGNRLFFGDDDGNVFQLFSSSAQNTAPFPSYVETAWFDGSDAKYKDTFYEIWGFGDKLSGIKVSYKLDNDDREWESIGEFSGSIAKIPFKSVGNRIKFLLEEYSKDNLWQLDRLDIGFIPAYSAEEKEDR